VTDPERSRIAPPDAIGARRTGRAPRDVREAAERRAAARAARDWPTADALRAEIEAAGWRIVDDGTTYRLHPASPADAMSGAGTRYGRSASVPSRLEEPAAAEATILTVAAGEADETLRLLQRLAAGAPATVPSATLLPASQLVVVADGVSDEVAARLEAAAALTRTNDDAVAPEVVRTSASIGHAAALNCGLRRALGRVVVVVDGSIEPAGDVVTPLLTALDDSETALVGPFGLESVDLQHFAEVTATGGRAVATTAIQGYLMAFRRSDAAARGPLDEHFRFYRNLDIWWSLVLRDEGRDRPPRRALVIPAPPLRRHEPLAWTDTPAADRSRLSRRNFYRLLDRFRGRLDLAAAATTEG
jgi:Glycosyl transferase family 2